MGRLHRPSVEATRRRPAALSRITILGWQRVFNAFTGGLAHLNLQSALSTQIQAACFTVTLGQSACSTMRGRFRADRDHARTPRVRLTHGALQQLPVLRSLLRRREWVRVARMTAVALAVFALEYSFYGPDALKSTFIALKWVIMPSPWRLFQLVAEALGVSLPATTTIISFLWPVAMFVVAWFIYRRISSDQPREIVAPFALTFAWVIVAPWVFAWHTAIAWATLTLVPRNRMTRWLTIVTVVLALWR